MLQLGEDTSGLRRALVTEPMSVADHCAYVASLQCKFNHTIRCVDTAAQGQCMTNALGIRGRYPVLSNELEYPGVKVSPFVRWLCKGNRLTECNDVPRNALALYFDNNSWMHAGTTIDGMRIRSKWGAFATFDHEIHEVQADYGNIVRIFSLPAVEETARLVCDFLCIRDKRKDEKSIAEYYAYCGLQR